MKLLVFPDFGSSQSFCIKVSRGLDIENFLSQNNVPNVKLCSTYENYFKAHFFLRMDEYAVSIPRVWFFIIHFDIFISGFSTILLNSFKRNLSQNNVTNVEPCSTYGNYYWGMQISFFLEDGWISCQYFQILVLHNLFAQKCPEGCKLWKTFLQNDVTNVKLCSTYEYYFQSTFLPEDAVLPESGSS